VEPDDFITQPKWRNWQTRRTQNPQSRKGCVGSIPTFGTVEKTLDCERLQEEFFPQHVATCLFAAGLVAARSGRFVDDWESSR
jgi:hypothetical protein